MCAWLVCFQEADRGAGLIVSFHARWSREGHCPGFQARGLINVEKVGVSTASKTPLEVQASWPNGTPRGGAPALHLVRGAVERGGADLLDSIYSVGGAALPLALLSAAVDAARSDPAALPLVDAVLGFIHALLATRVFI